MQGRLRPWIGLHLIKNLDLHAEIPTSDTRSRTFYTQIMACPPDPLKVPSAFVPGAARELTSVRHLSIRLAGHGRSLFNFYAAVVFPCVNPVTLHITSNPSPARTPAAHPSRSDEPADRWTHHAAAAVLVTPANVWKRWTFDRLATATFGDCSIVLERAGAGGRETSFALSSELFPRELPLVFYRGPGRSLLYWGHLLSLLAGHSRARGPSDKRSRAQRHVRLIVDGQLASQVAWWVSTLPDSRERETFDVVW